MSDDIGDAIWESRKTGKCFLEKYLSEEEEQEEDEDE